LNYHFSKYFYFNPMDGKIYVLDKLEAELKYKASKFLERYGINDNEERLMNRIYRFNQFIHNLKTNYPEDKNKAPFRFLFELALKVKSKL
jgi:hypothetical protein